MSSSEPTTPVPTATQFRAAQQSDEFIELRRTHRSFAFPMTVAFFVWYLVFDELLGLLSGAELRGRGDRRRGLAG